MWVLGCDRLRMHAELAQATQKIGAAIKAQRCHNLLRCGLALTTQALGPPLRGDAARVDRGHAEVTVGGNAIFVLCMENHEWNTLSGV